MEGSDEVFVYRLCYYLHQLLLQQKDRGPDYYEFVENKELKDEEKQAESKPTNTQMVAELKKIHEEALNASILNPTQKNILHERMLAVIYMDLAQKYQERAQMVVSSNPQINYMLRHPVDDVARKQGDDDR